MIVSNTAVNRGTITIRPYRGDFKPKKAYDHKIFKSNWMINIIRLSLTWKSLIPFRQIRKAEIPIRTYRRNHTGANNHDGGVKEGLSKSVYQLLTESLVKMEPTKPALKQAARLKNRRSTSRIFESFIILHNLRGSGMPCIETKANASKIIYQSLLACKLLC